MAKKKKPKINAAKPLLVGEFIEFGQEVCIRKNKYFTISQPEDYPVGIASTQFFEGDEAFLTGPLGNTLTKYEFA